MVTLIGPKMYFALKDVNNVGSTRLHKDVADAWNVLTYAYPEDDHAIWTMFSRKDTAILTEWMQKRLLCNGNPVHHQQTFLTKGDLADLWEEKKIRPYIINQKIHQFIFIPAGCAHQVRTFGVIFIFLLLYPAYYTPGKQPGALCEGCKRHHVILGPSRVPETCK